MFKICEKVVSQIFCGEDIRDVQEFVKDVACQLWAAFPARVKRLLQRGWKGGPVIKLQDDAGWEVTEADLQRNFLILKVLRP